MRSDGALSSLIVAVRSATVVRTASRTPHQFKLRKCLKHCVTIIEQHVISCPDDFETGIVGQESLEQVLLVPIGLRIVIHFRIRQRQADVMHMNEYAGRQPRQNLEKLILYVASGAQRVGRVQ